MQFLRDDDEDSSRPRSLTPPTLQSVVFVAVYGENVVACESVCWLDGLWSHRTAQLSCTDTGVLLRRVCVREGSERFATTYNLVLAGWMAGSSNLPDKRLRLLDY